MADNTEGRALAAEGRTMTFEQRMAEAMQDALVKHITSGEWIKPDYANRLTIPPSLLSGIYATVDMAKVKAEIVARVENKLADAVLNAMAVELATDVKKVLSNTELREDVRSYVRAQVRGIAAEVTS